MKKPTKEQKQLIEDAWLGIESGNLSSPFRKIPQQFQDRPELWIMYHLTKPEYFGIFCKEILNIVTHPFQVVALQELWRRRFPMFAWNRGASKSFTLALYACILMLLRPGSKIIIAGSAFRQSKIIFEYMERIINNAPVLKSSLKQTDTVLHSPDAWSIKIGDSSTLAIPVGCLSGDTLITTDDSVYTLSDLKNRSSLNIWGNQKFRNSNEFFDNGPSQVLRITTKRGYQYTGTVNHKMKVSRNDRIIWCRSDDLVIGDRILIDRSERWHQNDTEVSIDQSYCLGIMIGDGSYVNPKYLRYTTTNYDDFIPILNREIGEFRYQNDGQHYQLCGIDKTRSWLDFWGMDHAYAHEKSLPQKILSSSKEKIRACLQGLFDTDGHAQFYNEKGGIYGHVGYCTVSEKLARQIQYILLHFGIICSFSSRVRRSYHSGKITKRVYEILITGNNIKKFSEQIGFRVSRKQSIVDRLLNEKKRWYSIEDDIPFSLSKLPKYAIKDRKVITFDRVALLGTDTIWPNDFVSMANPSYFYDVVKNIEILENINTYDIHIPDGNEYCANGFYSHNSGESIRGLRSTNIFVDELDAHSVDVLENVIFGFASVKSSPVVAVQKGAARRKMIELGFDPEESEDRGNQIVLSGTCGYDFGHFADYWKKYKSIIASRGDPKMFEQLFGTEYDPNLDWRQFSIMRIPYDMLPQDFMDGQIIARAKISMHSGNFQTEYQSCFSKDSAGFFKRSLIESCCTSPQKPITIGDEEVWFDAQMFGDRDKSYVMGIDPASERDNFVIAILEVHPTHRRIVHMWSTTRKEQLARLKVGLTTETDYYSYCSRKIRELMIRFPTKRIVIDAGGGGREICQTLRDRDKMKVGELMLWPTIDPQKPRDEDTQEGLHIIDMIDFSRYEWVASANHNLRLDFEHKTLLFPFFNSVQLAIASEQDKSVYSKLEDYSSELQLFDTYENCILNIEELKNELASIIVTRTATGRERWDTPEKKLSADKKGNMKKDRYSALLLANAIAREIYASELVNPYSLDKVWGNSQIEKKAYNGLSYLQDKLEEAFDAYG